MSVSPFAGRREARDDDVGLKLANDPDDVCERKIVSPDLQRFIGTLRVAEVDGAREELFAPVDAPRGQQLLCADDAEELALFIAEKILAAVAPRHGKIRSAHEAIVGEPGVERGVFVVGMRRDLQRAADDGEFLERKLDLGRVGGAWHGGESAGRDDDEKKSKGESARHGENVKW